MLKWIKLLIEDLTENIIEELTEWLLSIMDVKMAVDKFCDWLMKMALKTENEVDDALVKMVKVLLYKAFGFDEVSR
jgi:pyruvate-formate lyase